MKQDELKKMVAEEALQSVEDDAVIGIGSGSTVNCFIEALATIKQRIDCTVASSEETAQRLKSHGIPVVDLNVAGPLSLYIDGADEVTSLGQMLKGGGGALTREKIIACSAEKFLCIVDESKLVTRLGRFPLAVEVIPMARGYVARELLKLGGDPEYREGFVSDNGNIIIDVHNLPMLEPIELEETVNNITGVVCHGLFAKRIADEVILASNDGIKRWSASPLASR